MQHLIWCVVTPKKQNYNIIDLQQHHGLKKISFHKCANFQDCIFVFCFAIFATFLFKTCHYRVLLQFITSYRVLHGICDIFLYFLLLKLHHCVVQSLFSNWMMCWCSNFKKKLEINIICNMSQIQLYNYVTHWYPPPLIKHLI